MTKVKTPIMNEKRQQELIMINKVLAFLVVILAFLSGILWTKEQAYLKKTEVLPPITTNHKYFLPVYDGVILVNPENSELAKLLKQARYEREIDPKAEIDKQELLALAWAGQGEITDWGERTATSYKSQFPIELKILVKNVNGISPGWYKMAPERQQIIPIADQELTLDNNNAPAIIVLTQVENTQASTNMIWWEAGEISQNILLMAQELNLSAFLTPSTLSRQQPFLWSMMIGHKTVDR